MFQRDTGIVHRLGHDRFHPNSFQFIIHQPSYHSSPEESSIWHKEAHSCTAILNDIHWHSQAELTCKSLCHNFTSYDILNYKFIKIFWEEIIAYFTMIQHGPHRYPLKNILYYGVDTQTHLQRGYLIRLTFKRGIDRQMDRHGYTDRQQGDLISLLLFF
jgi:hypothetical protein